MQVSNTTCLADLFTKYGSDKTTNGYTGLYECLFHKLRYNHVRFLEIGIGTMIPGMISSMKGYAPDTYKPGASLRAWRDYFINGEIYGLDVQPDTQFEEPRIKTIQVDSRSKENVEHELASRSLYGFDIILDDGSHALGDQLATLKIFLSKVNPGGYYIIEDVGFTNCETLINQLKNEYPNLPMFLHGLTGNILVIANPILGSIR
jgi:hypothetical protein